MSRREFLEILRSQLSGQMSQGKAAAHVRYYEDYIQSQVHNGRSEEEVLAELGDPRLIARTLIDTDDGTEVYDESGYTEESYGADDYADSSAGSTTGRTRSYKLDLSTWYGKAIVIAVADTFDNSFGSCCTFFDNFWCHSVPDLMVQKKKSVDTG